MTEALSLGHAAICLKDDVMMHHSLSHEMCTAGIMDDVLLVHDSGLFIVSTVHLEKDR